MNGILGPYFTPESRVSRVPFLVKNAAGVAANTNTSTNIAPPFFNPDPVFVAKNLLTTVYFWATTWDTAEIQLFISPQLKTSQAPTIWFPVTAGLISATNQYVSFQNRWAQIKAEVINASANTAGLNCLLFDPI
jgi:hypothetical protein